MAIITYDEPEEVTPPPPPVRTEPAPYKGVTVNTKYTPVSSLLTHVEGSVWKVAYYSQVLDTSDAVEVQQLHQAAVYQQYTLIKGLELRVNAPLQQSQNNETKNMVVTGSATTYPFLVPNRGDMFLADIGDGREGVFTVVNVEAKTILKETCYSLDYELVDHSTPARREDLARKTIKTVHFVKERMTYAQRPVLVESELRRYERLKEQRRVLVGRWLGEFYSRQYKVLLVPDQSAPTYEPFLTDFVHRLLDNAEDPLLRHIKRYNLGGDDADHMYDLWDCLLEGRIDTLPLVTSRFWTVDTRAFRQYTSLQSVYYSELRQTLYPVEGVVTVDSQYRRTLQWVGETLRSTVGSLAAIEKQKQLRAAAGLTATDQVIVHPIAQDDYYVFSRAFYEQLTDQVSILEAHVLGYLKASPTDVEELLWLCQCVSHWTPLERYYYLPVLVLLVTAALERGI